MSATAPGAATTSAQRAVPRVRYNPRQVRRLGRILLNALTMLSLLLLLTTVVLWVRSYSACDQFGVQVGRVSPVISTTRGGLALLIITRTDEEAAASDRWWWDAEPGAVDWPRNALGFKYEYPQQINNATLRGVVVPCWFVLLLSASLPGYRLARRIRRRHPPGHCPACGYDLRATPERCPECGTIPAR